MTFLIFGSLAFWAVISAYIFFSLFWADKDNYVTITTIGIFTAAVLLIGNHKSLPYLWQLIQDFQGTITLCFILYLILGVFWSFAKWYFYVIDHKKRNHLSYRPSASDHKGDIIGWMTYWPLSFISFLVRRPLRRIFTFIYERVSGVFENITNSVYNK